MVTKPGAGTVIAESEPPTAHHVTGASYQGEADGARTGDDNSAVATREGSDAGGIGIVVGNDRRKGQIGGGNTLDADRGDKAGKPEARVQAADIETGGRRRHTRRVDDRGDRRIEVLINVGGAPDRLAQFSAIGSTNAGPAPAAATIDPKKNSGPVSIGFIMQNNTKWKTNLTRSLPR
jgi:hypothetical protein